MNQVGALKSGNDSLFRVNREVFQYSFKGTVVEYLELGKQRRWNSEASQIA